jgi:hypothetical protein
MKEYQRFVIELQDTVNKYHESPEKVWEKLAEKYVDGLASTELRKLVDLQTRRNSGAFFTESHLAERVLSELEPIFDDNSYIYDPAVGAGNLLIAVSNYLKARKISFNFTERLLGTDIHKEFVDAARLRLELQSILMKSHIGLKSIYKSFDIKVGNGLNENRFYKMATHIIVNPPFQKTMPTTRVNWANGSLSYASIFIDRIISNCNPGVSISAILPDVLRSGSNYEKWRVMVNNTCIVERIKLLGQFDQFADVDVFAIKMVKRVKKVNRRNDRFKLVNKKKSNLITLETLFDVCVGPVVEYRDPRKGPLRGYVVSRGLPGWEEVSNLTLKRRHSGKSFEGPFVVIKRTSRMGDVNRSVATIINVPEPVFVENHLIVLEPKSKTIKNCRALLKILQTDQVNNFINHEIRCRHLTTKVVSKIPITM